MTCCSYLTLGIQYNDNDSDNKVDDSDDKVDDSDVNDNDVNDVNDNDVNDDLPSSTNSTASSIIIDVDVDP